MAPFKRAIFLSLVVAGCLFRPAPAVSDDDNTPLLEAVGGLSAAFVYQTHQTIGMLSDAKDEELYDEKVCFQKLQVTINLIAVVDKQLTALGKTEIDEADKKTIALFHTINKLLQRQGESLKMYWDADEEEHLEKYNDYRQRCEAKINEALGIKTEKSDDDEKE